MSRYYPIYVNLENKPVLVVGGGKVALRKVKTLIEHGALVRIVSPKILPELKKLVDDSNCIWQEKKYSSDDIQDAIIIFSCTEIEELNQRVAEDAAEACRLVNVVDDPEKCTFILPSIMSQGDLKIAVSTSGSSPFVAKQIRKKLEAEFGEEYKEYLALLKSWRKEVKEKMTNEQKEKFWERVTDGEVLELIKNNQLDEAKGVMTKCFRSLLA
ncbi:MAG: bifunctional precorrin-2 dehydrogenase/sirohydrochlorin ferrochelatase [Desulfitobacterium sp.]|nr:bifunctional precorrin-2 dehydrogenase/sirohydrochlorin ferrochelatase [Desulfitobacterium sp.]